MKPFIIKMINDSLFVSLYAPFYVEYGPGRRNSTAAWLRATGLDKWYTQSH